MGSAMFRYLARQTLQGILHNPWNHIIATATVSLAVFIFCAFLLILHNASHFLNLWQTRVEVTVYLRKGLPTDRQRAILEAVSRMPGVVQAHWVSEEEALRRFRGMLGRNETILEGLSANPLPASVELRVDESVVQSSATLKPLLERIGSLEGVETIQSGEDWVERMATLRRGMTVASFMLGGGLLLAVIFIISNTIKLTVYARAEEVEIMRLVGATDGFIRAPFVLEGMLQGFAGAALALGLVIVGFVFTASAWNDNTQGVLLGMRLTFFPWHWVWGLLAGGILVGGLASFLSLARFLQNS
jgi:cell division transport system permease protein